MAADEVIGALLDAAGLGSGAWTVEPLPGPGLLNHHDLVRVGAERFVVRSYGWPWGGEEPFDRRAKEAWLLPRLERAGVPAPRVLAVGPDALLLSFVEGRVLGELTPPTEAQWAAAGAALAEVHHADVGLDGWPVGLLHAGRVDAFEGGWAAWHVRNTVEHAGRLAASRPELGIDVDRCAAAVGALADHLDARPTHLVHTDANPWNVLVTAATATWVDWEFAWIGDPLYDLLRATLARKVDLGPLPPAFFTAYGGDPRDDPAFAAYELGFQLWMGNEALAAILPDQQTYRNAEAYLHELPIHLALLEERS